MRGENRNGVWGLATRQCVWVSGVWGLATDERFAAGLQNRKRRSHRFFGPVRTVNRKKIRRRQRSV